MVAGSSARDRRLREVPAATLEAPRQSAALSRIALLQRAAGNRAVAQLVARKPVAHAFPWRGEISAAHNAALRSKPHKDPEDPYRGVIADLDRGTPVTITGQERGWLRAEATVGGKKVSGYISRELVRHVGPGEAKPEPFDPSRPIDLGVLVPGNAFVVLKRAENRRIAMPDWVPTKEEQRELDMAADTLEHGGRYRVDRSTHVVTFDATGASGKHEIDTIEDFILFVEAVENEYPAATPGEIAGEIRQIQYAGGNWATLLNSPGISDGGKAVDIENPANPIARRFDIPALKTKGHKLTTIYGDVDAFHVVAGIDATLNGAAKSAAGTDDESELKFKTMSAAHGGDPRDFATWSGDLGQAYANYLVARYVNGKTSHKLKGHLQDVVSPEEFLGDIHGYIAAQVFKQLPLNRGTGWFMTGNDASLSNILRTLYLVDKSGTDASATYLRLFEQASGKSGAGLRDFMIERAVAFARIWYVKGVKDALGDFGTARRVGAISKAEIVKALMAEFDAKHAENEKTAAVDDRVGAIIDSFLPQLGGGL